jgi:DNA-binding MarR family transcriptional regulator
MTAKRASPPSHDTAHLATRLHSAAIHLLRRLRREDDASGLPAPLLSALSVLVFGGPATLGGLAHAEGVRPPTMSRVVDALEAAKLAERTADPDDGRVVRIRATAAGTRILKDAQQRRVAALTERLSALSAAERAALTRSVTILERVLSDRR